MNGGDAQQLVSELMWALAKIVVPAVVALGAAFFAIVRYVYSLEKKQLSDTQELLGEQVQRIENRVNEIAGAIGTFVTVRAHGDSMDKVWTALNDLRVKAGNLVSKDELSPRLHKLGNLVNRLLARVTFLSAKLGEKPPTEEPSNDDE